MGLLKIFTLNFMRILFFVTVVAIFFSGCIAWRQTKTKEESQIEEVSQVKEVPPIEKKATYTRITASQAKDRMTEDGIIILDVRTEEEFRAGYIPQAILLPVDEITARAEKVLPDKNIPILVYCRSGNRSRTASNALLKMGYTEVYDFGGIIDWPYDIEK